MAEATLIIGSKNYSAWSLRGWLVGRMSGLPFTEQPVGLDDPSAREELLLRSSSILVPCLIHEDFAIWDTLAIAEYLNERRPEARTARRPSAARVLDAAPSRGRYIPASPPCAPRYRVHSAAAAPGFKVWSSAQADIDRVLKIWRECLEGWGGPYPFGDRLSVADAMYAPVCTRFQTYDVRLEGVCADYNARILALPEIVEWTEAALQEADQVSELEVSNYDFPAVLRCEFRRCTNHINSHALAGNIQQ